MGISHNLLKPADNPLYGFGGKGTLPIGKIELPLSFGTAPNARSEQVTFDIVNMVYPYNAIMGQGSINNFEAAIHRLYMCMKSPGPQGAITIYGDQHVARNIERDFVPDQRNVHCLTIECEDTSNPRTNKGRKMNGQLQSNEGIKTVPLDTVTPKQMVLVSEDLLPAEEERLISCLNRNKDALHGLPYTSSTSSAPSLSIAWALIPLCVPRNKSCRKYPMKKQKPQRQKSTSY
jgi:hypothetical protein